MAGQATVTVNVRILLEFSPNPIEQFHQSLPTWAEAANRSAYFGRDNDYGQHKVTP
jgi:hypothetical protein